MKVEVVLTEADIAQEFAEAIEARDLPEKFFFWFTRRLFPDRRLAEMAFLDRSIFADLFALANAPDRGPGWWFAFGQSG